MDIDDLIKNFGQARTQDANAASSLKKIWVAERMCPELLPFEHTEVTQVYDEIKQLVAYIDEHSYNLETSTDKDIKVTLLIMETQLERLKFLIRAYLRTRIAKIDKFLAFYVDPQNQTRLTADEIRYAQHHFQLQFNLYQTSFMNSWPEKYHELQAQNNEKLVDSPDLGKPVVVKVREDTFIGEEEALKNEMWITGYENIREYVGTSVELI